MRPKHTFTMKTVIILSVFAIVVLAVHADDGDMKWTESDDQLEQPCYYKKPIGRGCNPAKLDESKSERVQKEEITEKECIKKCMNSQNVNGVECWAAGHLPGCNCPDCWLFYSQSPKYCVENEDSFSGVTLFIKNCSKASNTWDDKRDFGDNTRDCGYDKRDGRGCDDDKRDGCRDDKRDGCDDDKRDDCGCGDDKRDGCGDDKRDGCGCGDDKRDGCGDYKRDGCGCGDDKRDGCGDDKRDGCGDDKRDGCGDDKRDGC